MRGKRVQERVGRRVVGLPGPAERRRHRGEQHEHRTGRDPLVSSCRFQAASTFGRSTASTRSGVNEPITPSSSTPAACTTAVSGCCGRNAASTAASAHGRRRRTRPPSLGAQLGQFRGQSAAPGLSMPRRLTQHQMPHAVLRSPDAAPRKPPSAPVPPVISTVPSGLQCTAYSAGLAGRRRRAHQPRDPHVATPDRQLWLIRYPQASRPTSGRVTRGIEIHQHEPARVLRSAPNAPNPTPQPRAGSISPRATGATGIVPRTPSGTPANRSSANHACSQS